MAKMKTCEGGPAGRKEPVFTPEEGVQAFSLKGAEPITCQ